MIDENTKCHFYEIDCYYPINETELKLLLEEMDEGDVISQVPSIDSGICTNCLLSQVLYELQELREKNKPLSSPRSLLIA